MPRAIVQKTSKVATVNPTKMKCGGSVGTGGVKNPNGTAKGMKFVNQ